MQKKFFRCQGLVWSITWFERHLSWGKCCSTSPDCPHTTRACALFRAAQSFMSTMLVATRICRRSPEVRFLYVPFKFRRTQLEHHECTQSKVLPDYSSFVEGSPTTTKKPNHRSGFCWQTKKIFWSLIDIQKMFQFKIHEYLWIDPVWGQISSVSPLLSSCMCLKQRREIIINDEDERLRREMGFREIIMQKSY